MSFEEGAFIPLRSLKAVHVKNTGHALHPVQALSFHGGRPLRIDDAWSHALLQGSLWPALQSTAYPGIQKKPNEFERVEFVRLFY